MRDAPGRGAHLERKDPKYAPMAATEGGKLLNAAMQIGNFTCFNFISFNSMKIRMQFHLQFNGVISCRLQTHLLSRRENLRGKLARFIVLFESLQFK